MARQGNLLLELVVAISSSPGYHLNLPWSKLASTTDFWVAVRDRLLSLYPPPQKAFLCCYIPELSQYLAQSGLSMTRALSLTQCWEGFSMGLDCCQIRVQIYTGLPRDTSFHRFSDWIDHSATRWDPWNSDSEAVVCGGVVGDCHSESMACRTSNWSSFALNSSAWLLKKTY